jgi:hypothetical protein
VSPDRAQKHESGATGTSSGTGTGTEEHRSRVRSVRPEQPVVASAALRFIVASVCFFAGTALVILSHGGSSIGWLTVAVLGTRWSLLALVPGLVVALVGCVVFVSNGGERQRRDKPLA